MLSFLREQGYEDSSAAKQPAGGGAVPEAGEEPKKQEYLTVVAAQNKNVRKSTWLLAVLFGIGLLCLWFMIKKSAPQTAAATTAGMEEARIEMAITRLTGVRSEMFSGLEKIVKKFYEFSDVQQVEADELVKNPFKIETLLSDLKEAPDSGEFDIAPTAKDLELLTICQSDQGNCCVIDDRVLYEGDSIRGFKIRQISDSFVTLEWAPECNEGRLGPRLEGLEIVLKLSE